MGAESRLIPFQDVCSANAITVHGDIRASIGENQYPVVLAGSLRVKNIGVTCGNDLMKNVPNLVT